MKLKMGLMRFLTPTAFLITRSSFFYSWKIIFPVFTTLWEGALINFLKILQQKNVLIFKDVPITEIGYVKMEVLSNLTSLR